ncbi:response regulator [bacterium]|nr:response regulator [bacterium]
MSAEFLVLGGARASDSFALSEHATIGSDPTCDVRLDGAGVAAFHAVVVKRAEGGYRLSVMDGAAEVVVNGVSRREARLYHGQRIVVGGVELQFLCVADKDPKDTHADFAASPLPFHEHATPIERTWKSSTFVKEALSTETFERLDASERALRGLYLVGHAATVERSLARFLERASDAVHAALEPDRLVLALYEPEADHFVSAVVRRGVYDEKGARIPVSRIVVRKGAVDGISTLTRTRHETDQTDRAIICTPLTTRSKPVGAFYLERLPGARSFDDDDLDFLAAAGRIVGLSIERSRLEADAKSQAALSDRERSRWHAVVKNLRSGVLIVDGEGRVEMANPSARKILEGRLNISDASGLTNLGGVPLANLVARATSDQALEVVLPGSPEVVLEVRPSPVLDPDGGRAGAALLVSDATEERLEKARLLQAEKLSALGEMLAGVAHELNNPLATVLGYAEMLSRKAGPESQGALSAILEEAERCRRMVSSLLAFARARKAERTALDAGAVAASVLDLLAHEIKQGQIQVERSFPALPLVSADRYELQQVFFNLVKNAVEAIKLSGVAGKIAVAASSRTLPSGEVRVRVEVRDSGPGFPEEARGTLVPRPFFTTKGESGTGLGLSIAHGIVRDLGGTIEAGAAPEGGAAVAVELPAQRPDALFVPDDAQAVIPGTSPRGRRVLVVDDETHVREVLAQIVRELGHEPILAKDGVEALELLAVHADVDAILSDVRMPRMGGRELLEELRARSHPLESRLIFLSGDLARPETAAFVKGAGRPVLPKPFRLAQVCRALEDLLSHLS